MIVNWPSCAYGGSSSCGRNDSSHWKRLDCLQLGYPALAKITSVPAVAAQHGVTLEEWRALVQVTLDFHIRGSKSVAIARDMLRWIGYPGVPTLIVAPGQTKTSPTQRFWPSARTAVTRRSRLVRLLVYALRLDPEHTADQTLIEEFLHALWEAVRPLLSRTESGYYLELGQQAEITQVREAWLCPVTRRLLPITFRGITPYLPEKPREDLAQCQKVAMPGRAASLLAGSGARRSGAVARNGPNHPLPACLRGME